MSSEDVGYELHIRWNVHKDEDQRDMWNRIIIGIATSATLL
jgi:hypothetical protein